MSRFEMISRPVMTTVRYMVWTSRVLKTPSAKPKKSMGGIQPRAYSSAKQPSGILYCLTVPRCRWCMLPAGYTSGSNLPGTYAHCSPDRMWK